MIYLRLHNTEEGRILAMCDESLIDKVLEEGDAYIDIKGYSEFYKGTLLEAKDFYRTDLNGINSANIVGEESVGLAISRELIEEANVKRIKGVPYAHAYWVSKPGQD